MHFNIQYDRLQSSMASNENNMANVMRKIDGSIESWEILCNTIESPNSIKSIIDSAKSKVRSSIDYRYVLMDFLSNEPGLTEAVLRWNSLDAQDEFGKTILMHLIINDCNPKLVMYLLDKWVKKDMRDSSWMTAYDHAIAHKRYNLLELLWK